jgi:hypothetical protein
VLRAFGAKPEAERWVEDCRLITPAGVAAGSTWRFTWSAYLVGGTRG